MKKLLLLIGILCSINVHAQLKKTDSLKNSLALDNKDTVAWVYSGTLNMGLNQGFLHNWAAGGEVASATVNGLFSGTLTRFYLKIPEAVVM